MRNEARESRLLGPPFDAFLGMGNNARESWQRETSKYSTGLRDPKFPVNEIWNEEGEVIMKLIKKMLIKP